ncbi:MAG: hypothetical protein IJH50_14120 [Kiritimatiellae bacterium]|nr:hypothetical protein [Kiritimatiellia bacterium]
MTVMTRSRIVSGASALLAAVSIAVVPAQGNGWTVPSWDLRLSEPGAVEERIGSSWCGHAQGMCVTSNALFFAFRNQIVKTDWYGRYLGRVAVERSCGDICAWNGLIYAGICKLRSGCVRICAYDADTLQLVKTRTIPWDRGVHGITCLDGVIHLGMGCSAADPSGCTNWYGRFSADTLEPVGAPFEVNHGVRSTGGAQALATDGTNIYASFYPPDAAADVPCLIVFDAAFNVTGRHRLNWQQGFDVVPGGTDGAVRFIHCTTANWTDSAERPLKRVQTAVQFAELKAGAFKDITRHCIFRTPLPR